MLPSRSGIQPKHLAQQKDGMIIMQKAFFPFFFCIYKNYIYTTKKEPLSSFFQNCLCTLANKIRRFPVQAPIGAQLDLGTQPCYEAHSDWVETVKIPGPHKLGVRSFCSPIVHLKQYEGEQNIVHLKYLYLHISLCYKLRSSTVTDKQ